MRIRLDSKYRLRYKSTTFKIFHFIGKALLFLFILVLILIGFTQTSYFRNLLKNQVIELAQKELNGNLNIESIYGTLFSSLTIKNFNYSIDGVEFISAKTVHISINPLALIQNKIVVNKIFFENGHVNLIQFKDGQWITEKILKYPVKKDTTPSKKFNYIVSIKSLVFSDCQFALKTNADSTDYYKYTVYDSFNYDDLVISGLNLRLSTILEFPKNEYELKIHEFSFNTNVKNFSLEKLNLDLRVKDHTLWIQPLAVKTKQSDLKIYFQINQFDLSDSLLFEKFPDKNIDIRVEAEPFNFDDLRSIISEVDMLRGKLFLNAEANGSLKNLNVDYITARYDSTRLNIQGILFNLDEPENLYIKAKVLNSVVFLKDVSNLLPFYSIPSFEGLGKLNLNILYEGAPLNFKTDLSVLSSYGEITGTSKFNFTRTIPNYSLEVVTKNLNLLPIINTSSLVNSKLRIDGEGFEIKSLNTRLNFVALNSSFAENKIDSLHLEFVGKQKKLDFDFSAVLTNANVLLKGLIDFQNVQIPTYKFDLVMQNVDPAKNLFLKDFQGNLNFAGILEGEGLDLNNLNANLKLSILQSNLNNIDINESNFILKVNHADTKIKTINVRSDFVDIDVNGNYRFTDVLKTLQEKIKLVQHEIDKKIKLFKHEKDSLIFIVQEKKLVKTKSSDEKVTPSEFNLTYKIDFKNFDLMNVFLKGIKINLDGAISGRISSNNQKFIFENRANVKDFWIIDLNQSLRAKNTDFMFTLETQNGSDNVEKIKLITSVESEKIFTGSNIENLSIQVDYDSDVFKYKIYSVVDSLLSIRSEGTFDISTPNLRATIDKATITYKKYKLTNQGQLIFSFGKDKVNFEQFVLRRKRELYTISGEFDYEGKQNLKLNIEKLELYDLVLNFFPNITEEISGELTVNITINGSSQSPLINASFDLTNLEIGEDLLGNFNGKIGYENKLLNVFASYIDSIYQGNDFELSGYLPIDLSFKEVNERLIKNKEFEILINLNDFNLQPLRGLITSFKNIEGSLNGKLRITGTFDKPEFYGTVTSRNMNFILAQNNLKYSSDISIKLKENKVILEKFEVANLNTKKRGKLFTNAELEIDNKGIKSLKLTTHGSLLVLGAESRSVSPKVYGDLFFETASPIVVEGSYNNYNITGNINIKESSLIIPPIQSEYSTEEEMFVYSYVDYSPKIDPADIAFLQAEKELRGQKKIKAQSSSNVLSKVKGRIKISLKNNVALVLIFNQELNQRLFADLKGEVVYNFTDNQTSTQGEIELTKDSYLVFYQKFSASGKIRFESELSNPYLDVLASYSNYYIQGDTLNQTVKDVLVNLKLVGKVSELGKNLVNNRENIEVYIDGNLDRSKDASDVVAFILVGKFKDDLTAEDKTGALSNWGGTFQSAASSLLGSVVTNFANSILGDVLRNVELRRVGEETRFSFEGRFKDIRFKVGGGTDVFQNFALANIQIEYPVSDKLFLRLVRKSSQLQISKSIEMTNEIGLKYKVEF